MKDKDINEEMLYKQLEEALEERQTPDRRQKKDDALPEDVKEDRRKGDRRDKN